MNDWQLRCMGLGPAILGFAAVAVTAVGAIWCRTMEMNPNQDVSSTGAKLTTLRFGLVVTEELLYAETGGVPQYSTGQCVAYPDGTGVDGLWLSAIVLQGFQWIVGLVLSFILLFSTCCDCSYFLFMGVGLAYILVCVTCTGLMFLVWSSDLCSTRNPVVEENDLQAYYTSGCKLGVGSVLVILGACLYFIAGCLCFCLGKKPCQRKKKDEPAVVAAAAVAPAAQDEETPPADEEEPAAAEAEEEPAAAEEELAPTEEEPAAAEEEPAAEAEEPAGGEEEEPTTEKAAEGETEPTEAEEGVEAAEAGEGVETGLETTEAEGAEAGVKSSVK